jgi:hypothetical protein
MDDTHQGRAEYLLDLILREALNSQPEENIIYSLALARGGQFDGALPNSLGDRHLGSPASGPWRPVETLSIW